MNTSQSVISEFVNFKEGETFNREFFIAHTTLKRFPMGAIILILLGTLYYVIPGLCLLAYFAFRKPRISNGYATITNKRVIYYEFNEHPGINYRHISTLHISEITGMQFEIERRLWRKSFWMSLQTDEVAMAVGAKSFLAVLQGRGSTKRLEPGPDSIEFLQVMSGEIAAAKFAEAR